jgi:hypothetical protein
MEPPGTDYSGFGEILSVLFLIFEKEDLKKDRNSKRKKINLPPSCIKSEFTKA